LIYRTRINCFEVNFLGFSAVLLVELFGVNIVEQGIIVHSGMLTVGSRDDTFLELLTLVYNNTICII